MTIFGLDQAYDNYMLSLREAAHEIANHPEWFLEHVQREILADHGFDLDTMTDDEINIVQEFINEL